MANTPLPSTACNVEDAELAEESALEEHELEAAWRFSTDPANVGLTEGWYAPAFDDSEWRDDVEIGEQWEEEDVEYDGVAWYRATVTLPDWQTIYLSFGQPDDAATLWIDGAQVGTWTLDELDSTPVLLNLRDFGRPGDALSLVFRVEDKGGDGGLKVPLRWGPDPHALMDDMQYVAWLASEHPDWPMPGWSHGDPFGWTMTGGLGTANEALLSSDGALAPWATAPTAEIWLYDPVTKRLTAGEQEGRSFSLIQDALPIPNLTWEAFGVSLEATSFYDRQDRAVRWLVTTQNMTEASRELTLLVVVRPFAANKTIAPIQTLAFEGLDHLWVNDQPFLTASRLPQRAGVGLLAEAMVAASKGQTPEADSLTCAPQGDAMAVLSYPLRLKAGESSELHLAFPSVEKLAFPEMQVDVQARLAETVALWDEVTEQVTFDLPEETLEKIAPASVGYLLLAIDPDGPHPGPLAHDAVWVRDAAYVGLALLQAGHSEVVRRYIPLLVAEQEANGLIMPIQGKNIPWDDNEWDSQGQFIFLMTSYYRYTRDTEALQEWYPAVRASAQFLVDLRADKAARDEEEAPGEDPDRGLLPPSKSAEDLGPANWHHYWDNFWSVAGLEEAAYAARELGHPDDALWMEAEADSLRSALLDSIETVMGADPAYIPSAVESVDGSAMARGTVPALWPIEVLPRESSLLQRSFEQYYQLWIAPSDGGYRHHAGHFWPYGGLGLAHAYLRLGRTDILWEILEWTSAHQTLPGTFAWAEQVNPSEGGFSGGDMPHAWVAANYFTLIREMVVSEHDESLELFTGVPVGWFASGERIAVSGLPTYYGELTLETESTVVQDGDAWEGELLISLSGATPSNGFRWQFPEGVREQVKQVEGPDGTQIEEDQLVIPDVGGTVRLVF